MKSGGNIQEDVGSYSNQHTLYLVGDLCIQSCKCILFITKCCIGFYIAGSILAHNFIYESKTLLFFFLIKIASSFLVKFQSLNTYFLSKH